MPYAYMLRCCDDSFYVGSCWNLELRLWQHEQGEGSEYTKRRLPVTLVWCEEFDRIDDAFAREKQVQNWSRAKRIALIDQRYADLPRLAERYAKRRTAGGLDASSPSGSDGSTTG